MGNSSGRKIGFGLQLPQEGTDYPALKAHFLEAERLGYDSCWLDDHLFSTAAVGWRQPQGECYVWLGGLAEATSTLRIGTLVTCNNYRNPALLAKMAASLDQLSNGRFEFAIGAGWYEQEYEAFGYEFPKAGVRLDMLEESLEIYKRMMTEELPNFEGKYYRIKDCVNSPGPVQKPYPPIWIGGGGEKKTLRLVAKYADKWNNGASPEEFVHKIKILKEHCDQVGRNVDEIEKTWFGHIIIDEDGDRLKSRVESRAKGVNLSVEEFSQRRIVGTPEQVIARINDYVEAGVTHFIFMFGRVSDLRNTQLFARTVMPAFR